MTEVLDILNAVPAPLKGAWLVWLAWGAGQIVWYRRGRAAVVRALPAPPPRPRRPPKPSAPAESDVPAPDAAPEPPPGPM